MCSSAKVANLCRCLVARTAYCLDNDVGPTLRAVRMKIINIIVHPTVIACMFSHAYLQYFIRAPA